MIEINITWTQGECVKIGTRSSHTDTTENIPPLIILPLAKCLCEWSHIDTIVADKIQIEIENKID
jgi:hypothetical protein